MNNLELIKPLLIFDSEDDFYLLEIIQRKKENPDVDKNARVIKNYTISSVEGLENLMDEIIKLCEVFNARAGIRLNKRSFRKTAFETQIKIASVMRDENYKYVKNQYWKAVGSNHNDNSKKWIIDIDKEDLEHLEGIKDSINSIREDAIIAEIPSKSGIHLITKPFNRNLFSYSIEIHKDNPTNLWVND